MSWASFLTRAFSLILVLPLMVTRFSSADVALWYLFMTALNFQVLADIGFSSTLVRMFSYARSGLSINELKTVERTKPEENAGEFNWDTIETVWQVMNFVYKRLGVLLTIFVALSTWFLYHPILRSSDPKSSAIAWGIIIISGFIQLRYSTFSNYLQGMNQVALVKRWEGILNLFSILTNCLILYLGGHLLLLVISNQFWALVTIARDLVLSRQIANGRYTTLSVKAKYNKLVFASIWPSVWKSGVGTLMGVGVIQIINLIIADYGSSKQIASYLLGYNLIRQISTFSQAPFYSRIPSLAQLRARGDIKTFTKVMERGMNMSYWAFVLPVIFGGLAGTFGLKYIHSHVNFPGMLLWGSMGLALFLERCGAMHIQVYRALDREYVAVVKLVSLFNVCVQKTDGSEQQSDRKT